MIRCFFCYCFFLYPYLLRAWKPWTSFPIPCLRWLVAGYAVIRTFHAPSIEPILLVPTPSTSPCWLQAMPKSVRNGSAIWLNWLMVDIIIPTTATAIAPSRRRMKQRPKCLKVRHSHSKSGRNREEVMLRGNYQARLSLSHPVQQQRDHQRTIHQWITISAN